MIRTMLPFIVATLISCHYNKSIKTSVNSNKAEFLKSEFMFDDCDKFKDFLKLIIVNNKEDTTIKANHFTIPYIKSSYKFSKSIFHPDCFIGISVEELNEIFGERAIVKTQGGKIVTASTGSYYDWYYLQDTYHPLGINIQIIRDTVSFFSITTTNSE